MAEPQPRRSDSACEVCGGIGAIKVPHPSGYEEWGTIYEDCPKCAESDGYEFGSAADLDGLPS